MVINELSVKEETVISCKGSLLSYSLCNVTLKQ